MVTIKDSYKIILIFEYSNIYECNTITLKISMYTISYTKKRRIFLFINFNSKLRIHRK